MPNLLAADDGQALWFPGNLITWKATGEQTHGQLAVAECVHPAGLGIPREWIAGILCHDGTSTTEEVYIYGQEVIDMTSPAFEAMVTNLVTSRQKESDEQ